MMDNAQKWIISQNGSLMVLYSDQSHTIDPENVLKVKKLTEWILDSSLNLIQQKMF